MPNAETPDEDAARPQAELPQAERRNFYGRVHGKTLRASQKTYLAEDLGRLRLPGVSIEENPARVRLDLAGLAGERPLWLEIGFGGGEHLVHMAARYPGVALIGCEPFVNGIAMLLGKIRQAGVTNLSLHPGDVRDLFDVLVTSTGARTQPLIMALTTAGHDRNSICWEVHEYARQVKEGSVKDETFLPVLYEFPERLHHPKESNLLFPRVVKAAPAVLGAVDRLERDHMHSEKAARELQHLLLAWELLGASRRQAFTEAIGRYVDFYLDHMQLEEAVILPEAEKVLSAADWADIDAAFAKNADPLTGHYPPGGEYEKLFGLIVQHAPAPIGLG